LPEHQVLEKAARLAETGELAEDLPMGLKEFNCEGQTSSSFADKSVTGITNI